MTDPKRPRFPRIILACLAAMGWKYQSTCEGDCNRLLEALVANTSEQEALNALEAQALSDEHLTVFKELKAISLTRRIERVEFRNITNRVENRRSYFRGLSRKQTPIA